MQLPELWLSEDARFGIDNSCADERQILAVYKWITLIEFETNLF